MDDRDPAGEAGYDARRLEQWLSGRARWDGMPPPDAIAQRSGLSRRAMLRAFGAAGVAGIPLAAVFGARSPAAAATPQDTAPDGPIVKPTPSDEFYVYGSNAEMRWEVLRDKGYLVPAANFFVRDHTSTPVIDASTWRLGVFGTGLSGQQTSANPEPRDLHAR